MNCEVVASCESHSCAVRFGIALCGESCVIGFSLKKVVRRGFAVVVNVRNAEVPLDN